MPSHKRLYDQWNTKTVGGSTKLQPDDFDLIQDSVHIEQANEDALRLIKLIGEITGTASYSGPLADAGGYATGEATGLTRSTIIVPKGEVWDLATLIVNNGTDVSLGLIPQLITLDSEGSIVASEYLFDSAQSISAGADVRWTNDMLGLTNDIVITSTMTLSVLSVSGSPTTGNVTARVMYNRLR